MRATALFILAILLGGAGALPAQPASVALTAATDRGYYREHTNSEVYVEARIRATDPASATVRNLALVVDRSGSMAGAPLQELRSAIAAAVATLAERDTFAIVAFGSEVETIVPAGRRDQADDLESALARLEAAGGAALYDALNQGAAQLRRYAGARSVNHLILVTDGPPTKGPRERDDFLRLAEVFAREGITLSTIGLGADFDEDLLAGLARTGNGRFRYVDQPAKLRDALHAEVAPLASAIGHDAVLTISFKPYCNALDSHGWEPAVLDRTTVTYRFPHLFAGQDLAVLASAQVSAGSATGVLRNAVDVRLAWRTAGGEERETVESLTLRFDPETRTIRESINVSVFRTAAATIVSEGMQDAIEALDRGDFRRALSDLRRTRRDVRDLNANLEDEQIAATLRQLDTYLADVEARGLSQLDRKILRSGLFSQFEPPTADDTENR